MMTLYYCLKHNNPSGDLFWAREDYFIVDTDENSDWFLLTAAKLLANRDYLGYIGHEISRDGDNVFVALLVQNVPPDETWTMDKTTQNFCLSLPINYHFSMTHEDIEKSDFLQNLNAWFINDVARWSI